MSRMLPRFSSSGIPPVPGTGRADSFNDIFRLMYLEPFRTFHRRDENTVEAICLLAFFAIEMTMQLFSSAVVVIVAYAIFPRPAAVVNLVDEMPRCEHLESPEYARFVHCLQDILEVVQAESIRERLHCIENQYPDCRWPDAAAAQETLG